jgi:hypothetical protein
MTGSVTVRNVDEDGNVKRKIGDVEGQIIFHDD